MSSYYNEIDRQKAAWLRELIRRNLIAPGDVDERSIRDVQADDLRGYTQCHFFAGVGIWSYAMRLAGWPDERPAWTGSCPCPSFSAAGKGQGFNDPRHLWPYWFGLTCKCRPPVCFGEQVDDAIGHGWLDLVQTDMEGEAYAVGKAVLGACSVGAPHIRQRLYFCADTAHGDRRTRERGEEAGAGQDRERRRGSSGSGVALSGSESMHSERWSLLFDGSDGCDGPDGGRSEAYGQPGAYGEVCDRPDADGWQSRDRNGQRCGQQRLLAEDCRTRDSCDSSGAGLPRGESQDLQGTRWREKGRATSESGEAFSSGSNTPERGQPVCGCPSGIARYAALTGATRGFWADCDWWYGKDAKYRPIECGLQPLAHGSPARVLRLRGYGDGIVAQVAAAFVRAYMEVTG